MSALIDKLEQALRAGGAQPLGFGTATAKAKPVQLALVISLPRPAAEELPTLAKAGVEGVLLLEPPTNDFVAAAREHKLFWGVRVQDARPQEVQALKQAGCDFLVYGVDSPVQLFDQAGIGQVLALEAAAAESLAGALETLAPGAIYLPLDDMPYVSIRRLILCQRLARMARKPLLVQVHPAIAAEELAALCDAGAAGVVVEARGAAATTLAGRLRDAIAGLPPRGKRAKASKSEVVLPRLHLAPTPTDEGEPEEPDEDE